jgi:hypothetical protein
MHGPTCIFWANLTPFSLQWAFKKAFAKCDSLPTGCALELPATAPGVPIGLGLIYIALYSCSSTSNQIR